MKKIVVSGATSMLGIALIEECIKKGTHVVALVRRDTKKIMTLPVSNLLTVVACSMEDFDFIEIAEAKNSDAFFHFAWERTDNLGRNDPFIQEKNISSTLNAAKFSIKHSCGRFIGAGSQAEYGRCEGVIKETNAINPEFPYAVAKYAASKLVATFCEQEGFPFIWTRIFSVYGPYNAPQTMIMNCIKTLLDGKKPCLTHGEQLWDYLYSKDAGEALYKIGEFGKTTTYNIGSGEAKPLKEYILQIRDCIDPSLQLGFGEIEYSKQQVMRLCADIQKLKQDTGFVPKTNFLEGIEKTIYWYKKQKI